MLLRNATVLPVSGDAMPKADILVRKGKIAAIGKDLEAPEGVKVIDLAGMFVMPGIIDTHCHFAISGGVNEFSLSVVPEVRVRDVINSDDVQIYRALAGGVTTARLLHGSANVIGGQDAVIKLRRGKTRERTARRRTRRAASSSPWARTSSAPTAGSPTRAWASRRAWSAPSPRRSEYRQALGRLRKAKGDRSPSSRAATCGSRRWPTCCPAT